MSGQPSAITCDQCGAQYRWKPELAGRTVRCNCGGTIAVPAVPAPQPAPPTYDVVGEALLEELPPTIVHHQRAAKVLGYESQTSQPRMTIRDLIRHPQTRNVAIALLVIALGVAFRFCWPLFISSGGNARMGAGALVVLLGLVINVATMLTGVGAVAKLTGAEVGSLPVAALKLCAVAVFGSVLFAVVASVDTGDGTRGMLLAWHVVLLFNWVMFSTLFEFDLQESLFAVALVGVLQALGACAMWYR